MISPIKVPTGKENAHNIEFYFFIHIYCIVTKCTDQIHPAPGSKYIIIIIVIIGYIIIIFIHLVHTRLGWAHTVQGRIYIHNSYDS